MKKKKNALIVGAGSAGKTIAKEMLCSEYADSIPTAFVDDDLEKVGTSYKGIKVAGTSRDIPAVVERLHIEKILICLPSVDKSIVNEVFSLCSQTGCEVKILPDLFQLLYERGLSQNLKNVEIEDLLGRQPKKVLDSTVSRYYRDKVVMITGGGGSIGAELCRQVAKMAPKKIVIVDIYENCAYDVQQELKFEYGNRVDVSIEIASICNRSALERIFQLWKPDIVIMAAAHKHVPLMEHNVIEAVENNVFGTLNTVEMAEKYGADRVHLVSTDKAVNPTNIMGATKRICEMIVQAHSTRKQHTTFSATRFGNVLGSAGSVIPLFKRQIAKGGPVTVTDFRITRYFMTIPESAQLVLKSASMAQNGELFVLDMGEPMKIKTLAENMIRLSGYEPGREIQIIETGLRPGEKLYEELLVQTEEMDKTNDSLIFIERDKPLSMEELQIKLDALKRGVEEDDEEKMREIVIREVSTFIRVQSVENAAEEACSSNA